MCAQGELVAHCAREDEEAAFVGCAGGDVGLQIVGCFVFAEDVVLQGGGLDCGQHGEGGSCDRVAC